MANAQFEKQGGAKHTMKIRLESNRAEKIFRQIIKTMAVFLMLLFLLRLADIDYSQKQNEHAPRIGIVFENAADPFWAKVIRELKQYSAGNNIFMRDAASTTPQQKENEVRDLAEQNISLLIIAKDNNGRDGIFEQITSRQNDFLSQKDIHVVYIEKPPADNTVSPQKFVKDKFAFVFAK